MILYKRNSLLFLFWILNSLIRIGVEMYKQCADLVQSMFLKLLHFYSQWRSQSDNFVPLCKFKLLSLFIFLEIGCFCSHVSIKMRSNVPVKSNCDHPPPRRTPGNLTFRKKFGQIPHCAGENHRQIPQGVGKKHGQMPPPPVRAGQTPMTVCI